MNTVSPTPSVRAAQVVTPELIDAFARDGAVCLRGLLNADEVALLRAGIDANIAAPSPRAKVASRPDDPGFFIEDFCCWQDNDAYCRFIFDSPLAAAAARLLGDAAERARLGLAAADLVARKCGATPQMAARVLAARAR